jgi:tetratricopeptide (TPR) repeat protein
VSGGDIQGLTAQLARDPESLVFLPLAEALRQRRQLEAALRVAEQGAARYPEMAAAYDLIARIRSDRGEGDLAFDAWTTVLRLDAEHPGAYKGLAFLAYRSRDYGRSLRYLQRAAALAPGDATIAATVSRVRAASGAQPVPGFLVPAPDPLRGDGGESPQTLLVDLQGRVLAGQMLNADGRDAAAAVAAALAGFSREAERTARVLRLGPWQAVSLEGRPDGLELRAPSSDTVLVTARPREVPAGRLALLADRAAGTARRWLEELR